MMFWDFAARALCALRGIATVSRPSVTLRYSGSISWATSPQSQRSSLRGTPTKFGSNTGGVMFSAENLHNV